MTNPNTDVFDGDTLIILGANGADYDVKGGDPARDQGYINHMNISMLVRGDWCGNDLEPVESRKLGSQYIGKIERQPITRQTLIDASKAAEADVKGDEFGDQRAVTINPVAGHVTTTVFVQPVSNELSVLQLTNSGKSWINQILNPINSRASV